MATEILTPLTQEIEVAGRKFTLKEMPASEVETYFKELDELSMDDLSNSDEPLEEALIARAKKFNDFISKLLGGIEEEFIRQNLTPSIAWRVIEIQNRLNGLDELIKKVLLRLAKEKDEEVKE